ncbi:GNAT family N-acetyltransferase [Candidatus Raskinella chloraquaticus]|uniref:N-acetyltransferase domain-containing protein n=1 Tax=Candidatus Raskinella chloraquaticus TaxID=1951219 RepID=A0A1W9HYX1_9HYPH|nr:MAG: hypothetical protein A4S15_06905 [Proteobacteria bacterium SG_bin8]
MKVLSVDIRTADRLDAADIAAVHDAAWRLAYAGILPGIALEKAVQRRGPEWWARTIEKSGSGLMVLTVGDDIVGYVSFGAARTGRRFGADGEIYEIYLKPEYQGIGFGSRLFRAALGRLASYGCDKVVVWALAANTTALSFYRHHGGSAAAIGEERFGEARLRKLAFLFAMQHASKD